MFSYSHTPIFGSWLDYMKIFNINFNQNNFQKAPKQKNLAPLAYDTVTFSGRPKKDMPYSIFQKEREIEVLSAVINAATEKGELLNADELSEKTGLDVYVVKLRLSTSNTIRQLYNEMKLANSDKVQSKDAVTAKKLQGFIKFLSDSHQKLTESEIAFYLGIEKDKLFEIMKNYPNLSLTGDVLLGSRNCPPLERKAQNSAINNATRYISRKDTYESLSKRAELSPEIIRAKANEDDEFFKYLTESGVFPPDIYTDKEIEEQDDKIMNAMLCIIKTGIDAGIEILSEKTELYPGTLIIRIKNNIALNETYNRMLGVDEDED